MNFHAVFEDRLSEASTKADALRAEARGLLVNAVADAYQAGMTQREIAAALKRSQPEVSRLLGYSVPRLRARGPVGRMLVEHRGEVLRIAEEAGASNVRVFGSVARGEDDAGSDVDLLVDVVGDGFSLLDHNRLERRLSERLGVHVDLVSSGGLKGEIGRRISSEAVVL